MENWAENAYIFIKLIGFWCIMHAFSLELFLFHNCLFPFKDIVMKVIKRIFRSRGNFSRFGIFHRFISKIFNFISSGHQIITFHVNMKRIFLPPFKNEQKKSFLFYHAQIEWYLMAFFYSYLTINVNTERHFFFLFADWNLRWVIEFFRSLFFSVFFMSQKSQ